MATRTAAFAIAGALIVGCGGGPPALVPGNYSPAAMAAEALATYDTNKDGKIDALELKKCPSLLDGLESFDKSGDKSIDAGELTARFEEYRSGVAVLREVTFRVVKGGKGVGGVQVRLEPERFMLDSIKPAIGVSRSNGDAPVQTDGEPYSGAQIGCFRIVLSKKDAAGKEMIPVKYCSPSTAGIEIGPSNRLNLTVDVDR